MNYAVLIFERAKRKNGGNVSWKKTAEQTVTCTIESKRLHVAQSFLRENNGCHCSQQMHLPIRIRFETRNTLSKNQCAYAISFDGIFQMIRSFDAFGCSGVQLLSSKCRLSTKNNVTFEISKPKLCTDALHTCFYSISCLFHQLNECNIVSKY